MRTKLGLSKKELLRDNQKLTELLNNCIAKNSELVIINEMNQKTIREIEERLNGVEKNNC